MRSRRGPDTASASRSSARYASIGDRLILASQDDVDGGREVAPDGGSRRELALAGAGDRVSAAPASPAGRPPAGDEAVALQALQRRVDAALGQVERAPAA